MAAWQTASLIVGSLLLVAFSHASLRKPGSHGFYRFFAWECILTLAVLNLEHWFDEPLSPAHLLSWLLLSVSALLGLLAIRLLRRHGQPAPGRDDAALFEMEKTTVLVDEGIYHHIRHPLYSSLLFLAWGTALKRLTPIGFVLSIAATGFLLVTALADEAECLSFFGTPYEEYMQRTKRFIPFVV